MRVIALLALIGLFYPANAQQHHTILAIGAHAADMELTAGAILASQKELGDRIVLLHMTLGEAGNPKLPPEKYAAQKRQEASHAAQQLGAELILGPYRDALLPNDEGARRFVVDVIRRVQPDYVITRWKNSFHKDHANTYAIVKDAVLMAELEAVKTDHPPYLGVKGVYYAENWEDDEGYKPYLFINASRGCEKWSKAIQAYQMVRGGISPFHYFEYYTSLVHMRGAQMGQTCAETLDVEDAQKRVNLQSLGPER
jgi:LmbE family N-acetylglucosaminyl deacetylase